MGEKTGDKSMNPDTDNLPEPSARASDDQVDNRSKVDWKKAFSQRFIKGWSLSELAKTYGVSKQCLSKAFKPFNDLLKYSGITPIYDQKRSELFKAVEVQMLLDIVDEEKRKKATQGNAAYAFDKVHGARMIEENKMPQGGDITIILQGKHAKLIAEEQEITRQLADLRQGAITVNEDSEG